MQLPLETRKGQQMSLELELTGVAGVLPDVTAGDQTLVVIKYLKPGPSPSSMGKKVKNE